MPVSLSGRSASILVAGTALLTIATVAPSASLAADTLPAHPRFVVLPATNPEKANARTSGLTTWNFSYTYNSRNYTDVFVGNAPSGGSSTTPSFIIPLKIVLSNV